MRFETAKRTWLAQAQRNIPNHPAKSHKKRKCKSMPTERSHVASQTGDLTCQGAVGNFEVQAWPLAPKSNSVGPLHKPSTKCLGQNHLPLCHFCDTTGGTSLASVEGLFLHFLALADPGRAQGATQRRAIVLRDGRGIGGSLVQVPELAGVDGQRLMPRVRLVPAHV